MIPFSSRYYRFSIYSLLLMISLFSLILLPSCHHKEFCWHHPHSKSVRVEFDWQNAPDADPEGMCVFFYPIGDTDAPIRRFDFAGNKGGEIVIQSGYYRVICYNNDTEVVNFRNVNSYELHEAFTRDCNLFEPIYGNGANYAPRADGTEEERVVLTPDMMWNYSVEYVDLSDASKNYVITLYPKEPTCVYSYEVRNVKNIKHTTQMCGSLSGMAPSMRLADDMLSSECVTIPFGASSDGKSSITGRFLTFGHNTSNEQPHILVLYVWFVDGSKYYYSFDVTEQVHNAPNPRRVHLIIDGLEFPQPIVNGNGLKPSVDDWFSVEEDIIM